MDRAARTVKVSGRVQGVFFRDSCRQEAQARGVAGWVSNEADGSVAAYFEGDAADVQAMVDWCRTGPAYARVERVQERVIEPQGMQSFEVR